LPGVPNVFIEGSYQGRKAAPGKYTARLRWEQQEKTVLITVLPDPRIQATAAAYEQQQQTLAEIDSSIKEMHDAVNRMRVARRQVNELLELLTDTVAYKPVREGGKKLVSGITVWEEKLVQPKAQSNDDIINFVNMLSADYIFLKGELDTNLPAVTSGQQQRLAELNAQWQPLKEEYGNLQKQVADFNALCQRHNIGRITLPVAAE
jgi:chromosome segregation ATPase